MSSFSSLYNFLPASISYYGISERGNGASIGFLSFIGMSSAVFVARTIGTTPDMVLSFYEPLVNSPMRCRLLESVGWDGRYAFTTCTLDDGAVRMTDIMGMCGDVWSLEH